MRPSANRLRSFYNELKRRHVIRVVVTYAVSAAAVVQIVDVVFPALTIPPIALSIVVVLAILGLPLSAVLAWTFELSRDRAAPAAAAEAEPSTGERAGIPAAPSPLIGRGAELARLHSLLTDPATRLVTLIGPGGVGKTRLAFHAASGAAAAFHEGAVLVQLAGVESETAVPLAIAEALGLRLSASESADAQVIAFLRERSLLLTMDNFEQVLGAVALLGRILAQAPRVRMLVTSRVRLAVGEEVAFPVEGLPLPAAGEPLESAPSAQLFLQSARRLNPRFELRSSDRDQVRRICGRLEGMPLALELAGGCTAVLSCAEIAAEIEQNHDLLVGARRDMPTRHQGLRAAFESSWRLLSDDEQRALRRLSVFRSGFGREEATAVAGADLSLVARLVDKSLVRRVSDGRYDILEQLRTCAEEKLDESAYEATATRQLHCQFFIGRLEELGPALGGPGGHSVIARTAARANDIRAAWAWATRQVSLNEIDRGVHGLYRLYEATGWSAEAIDLFAATAARLREVAPASGGDALRTRQTLARVLVRQGATAIHLGRMAEARQLLTEGIAISSIGGDPAELAFALNRLSEVARVAGEYEDGAELAEKSLELSRSIGDVHGVARALNSLGSMRYLRGRYDEARRLYQQSVDLYRGASDTSEIWLPLTNLGAIAILEGAYDEAHTLLESNLRIAQEQQNVRSECLLLHNLGYVELRAGRPDRAEDYLRQSIGLSRSVGFRSHLALSLHVLAMVLITRGEDAGARAADQEALTLATESQDVPLVLETLVGLARQRQREGDATGAHTLLRAVHLHPACDEETRREAEALLVHLDGHGSSADGEIPDLDTVIAGVLRTAD